MKNLLLLTFILFSTALFSQNLLSKTVVYADDGSVYVGEILSENILDIKMVIGTLDTIVLDKRSIKKMNNPPKDMVMYQRGKYHRTGGMFYSFALSSTVSGENEGNGILNFIIGKRLNEKWHIGAGLGFSAGSVQLPGFVWVDHEFFNVSGYGRYNVTRNKVILFTDASLGIGLSTGDRWRGSHTNGIYFQPGVGIEFASRKKLKWSIKLSQYMQNTSGTQTFPSNFNTEATINYKQFYNRTMIGVGMTF